MIAGLKSTTPFASRIALSQPYITARIHVAVPPGATFPKELTGHPVAVAPRRVAMAAAVQRSGAIPESSADLWRGNLVLAAYDFEIEAHGLQTAGSALAVERHVIDGHVPGHAHELL